MPRLWNGCTMSLPEVYGLGWVDPGNWLLAAISGWSQMTAFGLRASCHPGLHVWPKVS